MTFIYEYDPYFQEIYWMCKYELPTSRLSKVIVLQTHKETDTTENIYHAASRVVKNTMLPEQGQQVLTEYYLLYQLYQKYTNTIIIRRIDISILS